MFRLDETDDATIVYYPNEGEDMSAIDVVMPVLEQLIVANGTHGTRFEGLIFEHATWVRPRFPHRPRIPSPALFLTVHTTPQLQSRPNSGEGYVEQQSGALVDKPAYDGECIDYEWKPMPSNGM